MHLKMNSSREMHELLARGTEGDPIDDSKVCIVNYPVGIPRLSPPIYQFRPEEITVPYIQGRSKEERTYTVRYRPAMEAVLHTIEDPDLQEVLTMYPQKHYVRDPCNDWNMRVWTDVHTADDWWSLQVRCFSHFLSLF
jgi:hypothetical protein